MTIQCEAHAKINWSLNILGLREDGYHILDMLMQPLALSDTLIFEDDGALSLTVDGQTLPDDGRNLVTRAAKALNAAVGTSHGARIRLFKRIPQRAGLGGGSADCAAALVALNRLWALNLPMERLMEIGGTLGADVPFCLLNRLARVCGIGERLTPLPGAQETPLVMVTPGGGLSTAEVFRAWDAVHPPVQDVDMHRLADALARGDFARAQALSFNSLETPAISLMPEIGDLMHRFRALGALFTRMTGSGSTVFAVFDTEARARSAAAQVSGATVTRTMAV